MHSDIRPLIVYTRNNSVDANVSGRVCTATESPLGTCLTDIMQALECEECVEAWSVTLKRHQTDDVTSQAAWWLVECSGGVLLYSFFILLFLYYPLPLFSPAGCSSPVCTTVFAMNMFRESPLCTTWWMRTVENALHSPLMLSPWPTLTTVYVYILHFNGVWKFSF